MTNDPTLPTLRLTIDPRCALSPDNIAGFAALLQDLLPLAQIPDLAYLGEIKVIPDGQTEAEVNALFVGSRNQTSPYVAGPSRASAIAVPIERDSSERLCYILLEEQDLQGITPKRYHPMETVSSLLEELLHTRVYSTQWRLRPSLLPDDGATTCVQQLRALCARARDEYLVGRWKAGLFSTLPLRDYEDGLAPALIIYPVPLGPMLDNAAGELADIVTGAADGFVSIDAGWTALLHALYRGVLEPLTREAAFQAGNSEPVSAPKPRADQSWFYQDYVRPFWERFRAQLEHSFAAFASEPAEADAILDQMRTTVDEFLALLGVRHRRARGNRCRISFDGAAVLDLDR